jgi:chromosome segregation ATPase
MGSQLNLSIIEIIVLMIGAITLGFTIHFFVFSRKTLNDSTKEASGKTQKELDSWRMKYYNELEYREKELSELKKLLAETEESNQINTIEADEMRKLNKQLKAEMETHQRSSPAVTQDKPDYIDQLRKAQTSLLEHNEKINTLLGQIDIVKETEEKQQEMLKANEEMSEQIAELKFLLSQKEKEVTNVRQKQQLSTEMTSMLDSAYNEFNVLQEKIQKLESQVNISRRMNMEYEDLKEGHYRIAQDYEEQKKKYNTALSENKQLLEELTETEDKLKEANLQRQQLQKRVAYLEELNNDMQAVADANKKLENQLKRIGELESMLNVVAEERDTLVQRQTKTG